MIDTLTFQIRLNYESNLELKNNIINKKIKLSELVDRDGHIHKDIFAGKIGNFSIFFNSWTLYLFITINPSNLLGKPPTTSDVLFIENGVKYFVSKNLYIPTYKFESFNLNRIDYKVDCKLNNVEEKNIVFDLMKIATNKFDNIVKVPTRTSIRYNPQNGYIEFITYDKEQEVIDKSYFKNTDVELIKKFKNVIRTEIRVKNRKLNYNKRSIGLSKDLVNYLSEDMAEYYFNNYATKIWYTEPFYRLDIALKMINENINLTKNMKEKLSSMINHIYLCGFTATQDLYDKKYSRVTFRSHIKKIRELGINPLTFSTKYSIEKLENFSLRKRSMP